MPSENKHQYNPGDYSDFPWNTTGNNFAFLWPETKCENLLPCGKCKLTGEKCDVAIKREPPLEPYNP